MLYRITDLVHVWLQYGGKHLRLGTSGILHTHSLHACKLILYPALQRLLKLGISLISQHQRKAHYCRFADMQRLPEFRRRHKYRFIIVIRYVRSDRLLAFAHPAEAPAHIRHKIFFSHIFPVVQPSLTEICCNYSSVLLFSPYTLSRTPGKRPQAAPPSLWSPDHNPRWPPCTPLHG